MRRYRIHERFEVERMARRLLPGIPLSYLHDNFLTAVNGYITIDLCKLDEALSRRFPEESESISMADIVRRHYGEEAFNLILALI